MDKLKYYLLIYCCSPALTFDNIQTLKSISVTFRHGDRAPNPYPSEFYPTDPYLNLSMEPMGYGGLTNEGKRREYQIGVKLRERYDSFLGDIYRSKDVSVVSTKYERTEMSLLLVLAGLYPPKGGQVWKNNFDWQPIPINSVLDMAVGFVATNQCPVFLKELEAVKVSEDYKKDFSAFEELTRNLTILTGRETKESNMLYNLFHTLTAESAMNLEPPKWTVPYFPDGPLKDAVLFEYRTQSYTQKLRRLNGGVQIRKILNDILFDDKRSNKKVNLYSTHESTIAALMYTLNVWRDAVPEYGSAVIIELHNRDEKNYLKIVYYNSIPPTFETRIIPGCSEYCPIEDFLYILKDVIPDDVMETCYGPPSNSLLIPKSEDPIEWIYRKLRESYGV